MSGVLRKMVLTRYSGAGIKGSRPDRTCRGQLLWREWRRVTHCHVLWSIVTKSSQQSNIRTLVFVLLAASSEPRAPSCIHLSRLRAGRHEPLRPQQLISHPDGPRVIRVSFGRKHDKHHPGHLNMICEWNLSSRSRPFYTKSPGTSQSSSDLKYIWTFNNTAWPKDWWQL